MQACKIWKNVKFRVNIAWGACRKLPFTDLGFENGLNRLYFVCTRLHTSFFVCTLLTFLPLPRGLGTCYPPFSDFGFENGLNRLYFVCTRLYKSSFLCTPLTFLPPLGRGWLGTCYTFLILDSKMGSIIYTSFVHDCIRLFSFTFFKSLK